MSRLKAAIVQFHLVVTFIFELLITNVGSNHLFIQTNRRNKVPSGPEHLASEVPLPASEVAGYRNRTLPFDITNYVRYRMLWRYAQTHMNVIYHQMSFDHLRFPLQRKLPKYLAQMLSQCSEYRFLAPLRNKCNMIFTIPSGMTQTLILFHRESPSLSRERRFTATDV